jgi:hypothetical protein
VKLITTSVVRGSHQGQSHGGVYLIDLERRSVRQALDWNRSDIDWQGRGWDRGLRGIAFDGELVYVAASDELFAFTPDFQPAGSWRNAYLKHCHEIAAYERTLYLTSTGFDSILAFDLDAREFHWAMHLATQQFRFRASIYDPRQQDGPLMLNKLHVNSIHCTQGGMYITGLRTGGMLLFNGKQVQMTAACSSTTPRPMRCATRGEAKVSRTARCRCPATAPTTCRTSRLTRAVLRVRGSRAACACCRVPSWPAAHRRRPCRFTTWRRTSASCR